MNLAKKIPERAKQEGLPQSSSTTAALHCMMASAKSSPNSGYEASLTLLLPQLAPALQDCHIKRQLHYTPKVQSFPNMLNSASRDAQHLDGAHKEILQSLAQAHPAPLHQIEVKSTTSTNCSCCTSSQREFPSSSYL